MIELVRNNPKSKQTFLKEIQDLKALITVATGDTEREILITPSEVEQFKSNLKRSVLLSSSHTNKYHDSTRKMATTMRNSISGASIQVSGSMPRRESKIEFSRFSDTPWRNSGSQNKVERQGSFSSRSGLRKSIMSFVDDTLSSVFGAEREISKQMANNLEVFLKFSMILEKHLNDPDSMLYHLKKKFMDHICLSHADSAATAQRMPHFVDSINQFMAIFKESVIDYYYLPSFAEGEQFENPFIANDENILSICRTIFFKEKPFYETIFQATVKFN